MGLNENEALTEATANVMTAVSNLLGQIQQWKQRHIITTPIAGELEMLGFWKENAFTSEGQEVFAVVPPRTELCGEVRIPVQGAGKIRKGQDVNVKLQNYPYQEFGFVKAKVADLSCQLNRVGDGSHTSEGYLVRIVFPDGLHTNYGRQLPSEQESVGTAEIITNKYKLIERLFDNLRKQGSK